MPSPPAKVSIRGLAFPRPLYVCVRHRSGCALTAPRVEHAELYWVHSLTSALGPFSTSSRTVAANQEQSITTQLNDGIRMLQAQGHKSTNSTPTGAGIDLCHTR